MDHPELVRRLQVLESLINKANGATAGDLELQAHWAKYLCVIVAGFLEAALREVYVAFTQKSASPQVAAFAISTLSGIQNPKAHRFIEIAKAFKSEWGEETREVSREWKRKGCDRLDNGQSPSYRSRWRLRDYNGALEAATGSMPTGRRVHRKSVRR